MAGEKFSIFETWSLFTSTEKRNIAIYIAGIMLYKFGLEAFNGSITALATNRYDWDAEVSGTTPKTFERVGLLQGLNQAFQCVGAILIAPLIKRFPTKIVLSAAVLVFGLFTAILLIVDAATGGRIKPDGADKDDYSYYGSYNTDGMIPIYCVTGIAYGMVELIRRVIPRDIVGGNVQKLRRMDAMVHIFYEISGTSGAFCTALGLIPALGNNMSFIITPILFTCAAAVWYFVSDFNFAARKDLSSIDQGSYFKQVFVGFILFFKSVFVGGKLILSTRRFMWLLPAYSIALYAHRYLENGIAPIIAKRYLGNSAWSQIMVGGSNFGELCGAAFVFFFTNLVRTPIPWLRLDALLLMIVWYLPYWYPPQDQVRYAWIVAATFLPISFGWAAGDVSLAAYIQAALARKEDEAEDVSSLGAVMSFLYSTYIVIYAICNPLLGRYADAVYARNEDTGGRVNGAIRNLAGVQFTIIAVVVIGSSFVPRGAFAFNPKDLYGESLDRDLNLNSPVEDSVAGDFEKEKKGLKLEEVHGSDEDNPIQAGVVGGATGVAGTLRTPRPSQDHLPVSKA